MNDLRNFISLLLKGESDVENKIKFSPEIKEINSLITKVYKKRYKSFFDSDNSDNGPDMVDKNEYIVNCWGKLFTEGEKLSKPMLDCEVDPDDQQIRKYIVRIFRNELEEMIVKLTPGFRTRKKQLDDIFNHSSLVQFREVGKRKFCQLKNSVHPTGKTIDSETLDKIFASIPEKPEPLPAKEGALKAPGISKNEMEQFLCKVLRMAEDEGGMVEYKNLLEKIKQIYGLKAQVFVPFENPDSDNQEPVPGGVNLDTFRPPEEKDEIDDISQYLLSEVHERAADGIVEHLNERLRTIYYHCIIREEKLTAVGEEMDLSPATISNSNKKIQEIIRRHLSAADFSREEYAQILEYVSSKISKLESEK